MNYCSRKSKKHTHTQQENDRKKKHEIKSDIQNQSYIDVYVNLFKSNACKIVKIN